MVTNVRNGRRRALEACVLLLAVAGATGCGRNEAAGDAAPAVGTRTAALGSHANVPLRDRTGAQIQVGAAVAYSPEKTCGGCHDTAVITEGYHFQQGKGRSNAPADIYVADNYNPAKPWLLSDGMYGKW